MPRVEDRYPPRDHTLYRQLWELGDNRAQSVAELKHRIVNSGGNILWYLEGVTSDLPKPDLLHTMQIGMLKHLLGWLQVSSSSINASNYSIITGSPYLYTWT